VREDAIERRGDAIEIERVDEQYRVPLLSIPHEAVQLVLVRPVTVRRLLLEGAEGAQLALLVEDALHSCRPECTRQLVFEVARTGEEAGTLELASVGGAECAQEVLFLAGVVEPGHLNIAVPRQEARQVSVPSHRHDRDTFCIQVAATTPRERLDRGSIARAFDQYDRAQFHVAIRSAVAVTRTVLLRNLVTPAEVEAHRAFASVVTSTRGADGLIDRVRFLP
jgi:hypothetical protein